MNEYPQWFRWWRTCLQCERSRFDPLVGKMPWRREWQPTPVFLPGKTHGERNLAILWGPCGCKESDTTEGLTLSLSLIRQRRGEKWEVKNGARPRSGHLLNWTNAFTQHGLVLSHPGKSLYEGCWNSSQHLLCSYLVFWTTCSSPLYLVLDKILAASSICQTGPIDFVYECVETKRFRKRGVQIQMELI